VTRAKKITGRKTKFLGSKIGFNVAAKLCVTQIILRRKINYSFHTISIIEQQQKACQAPLGSRPNCLPVDFGVE